MLVSLRAIAVADAPPPPPADPAPAAAPHLERGLRLYATQRYGEALVALRKGYEVDPHPDFLYAIGQAERMSGNCKAAVEAYRAYLRTRPPELEASRANAQIERCATDRAPASTTPPPAREFGVPGIIMASSGIVAIAAGTGLLIAGGRHAREANDGYTLDERDSHRTAARNYRIAGGVALVGGVTLGALAVVRLLRAGTREAPAATTVTASAGADHVYIGAQLRF